jgi:hypothetical protein
MTVDQMVAEGDLVSVMWTFRGTHTDFGYGLPPTGAKVVMRGITIWRIVDGRIREEWTEFDELGAYGQVLGHVRWMLIGVLAAALALIWGVRRWWRRRDELGRRE